MMRDRPNPMLFLLLCALACLSVGCVRLTDDPNYVHVEGNLYDEARVVRASEFEIQHLRQVFAEFAEARCRPDVPIARLTVSPSEWDLLTASNLRSRPDRIIEYVKKEQPGFEFRFSSRPEIAQIVCSHGSGVAVVRRGGDIRSFFAIGGSGGRPVGSREFEASGVVHDAALVGFAIQAPRNTSPRPVAAGIYFFAVVKGDLPHPSVAQKLHDGLEKLAGVRAYLILRTDSYFGDYGGPMWDLFDLTLPTGTTDRFQSKPHVACPPSETGGRCMTMTTGRVPQIPAEMWGTN